jgi:hypothetical protein
VEEAGLRSIGNSIEEQRTSHPSTGAVLINNTREMLICDDWEARALKGDQIKQLNWPED